jgi:hypothetical protein
MMSIVIVVVFIITFTTSFTSSFVSDKHLNLHFTMVKVTIFVELAILGRIVEGLRTQSRSSD